MLFLFPVPCFILLFFSIVTADIPKLLGRHKSILSTAETDDDADDSLGLDINQEGDRTDGQVETHTGGQTDNQAILRLLGDGEKVIWSLVHFEAWFMCFSPKTFSLMYFTIRLIVKNFVSETHKCLYTIHFM